jgi:hypothetical protein
VRPARQLENRSAAYGPPVDPSVGWTALAKPARAQATRERGHADFGRIRVVPEPHSRWVGRIEPAELEGLAEDLERGAASRSELPGPSARSRSPSGELAGTRKAEAQSTAGSRRRSGTSSTIASTLMRERGRSCSARSAGRRPRSGWTRRAPRRTQPWRSWSPRSRPPYQVRRLWPAPLPASGPNLTLGTHLQGPLATLLRRSTVKRPMTGSGRKQPVRFGDRHGRKLPFNPHQLGDGRVPLGRSNPPGMQQNPT